MTIQLAIILGIILSYIGLLLLFWPIVTWIDWAMCETNPNECDHGILWYLKKNFWRGVGWTTIMFLLYWSLFLLLMDIVR